MRHYTTIPNVFRLASLQTINNNSHNNNNNNNNGYSYDNNAYNDNHTTASQQSMIIATTTTTTSTTLSTMATTTQAIVHNGGECGSINNNVAANDAGAGSENVAIRINYPHKLTTIASIERHCNGSETNAEQRKAHSPYATLPRGISLNNDHIIANGNLRLKMSTSQKPISSAAVDDERIINTISGSIPSTGYTGNLTAATNNNCNSLDQTGSLVSDLNISFTDFSQLNTIDQQQHLMPLRDFHLLRSEHDNNNYQQQQYQSSRRLSHKSPFHVSIDRKNNNNNYLWILTPVAASISVAIVIAAIAGPQWLFTEEKLPNANYNGTANFNALDDGAYITKYTKSSLWILCTTMQGVETYNCIKIDYFPKEGYQPEAHDSTSAIPYTVRKSAPLFLISGFFLLISFIVYLIPTCSHQNSLYYFSAGIMFIVSGLFMLIGLITYISTLKAEIGSKLRPRSALQPALLRVTYGQSFFLYVFGFVATEFVGVLNIFLYISLQEIGYYSRLPCLTFANLREKIKEGQHPCKHQYQLHHAQTVAIGLDQKPLPRRMRQVHNTSSQLLTTTNNSEWNDEKVQLSSTLGCRKHPQGPEANTLFNNDLERRFYFEKSANKCNLHSKNLAKSLNELYDESSNKATMATATTTSSAITNTAENVINEAQLRQQQLHAQYHHHQQQQKQQQQNLFQLTNLPQEFPLTRSISTTTELFANSNYGNGNNNGNYRMPTTPTLSSASTMATKASASGKLMADHHPTYQEAADQEEDQYNEDIAEPKRLCGIKRSSIRRTKDDIFQDFCKRAGVRPKPKNIYYIATEEEQARARRHQLQATKTDTLSEVDEQLYAIEDNQQNSQNNAVNRNTRRASMFVEPLHFRKLANSNLSLHTSTLYAPEVEHFGTINNIRPLYSRGLYGGSQTQLHQQEYNNTSRTLPRSFLKQHRYNGDSQDSMFGSTSLHASNMALHTQHHQLLQQQQQLQHQPTMAHFQPASAHLLQPLLTLHKSCEKLNVGYPMVQQQHQQQLQQLSPQVTVQWPAAIPSSPANFNSAKFQLYSPTSVVTPTPQHMPTPHALLSRSASSGAAAGTIAGATPKFQRTYAFDDQRRPTVLHNDTFDLDEIERERRRSHANLLGVIDTPKNGNNSSASSNEQYDLINGTAV